MFDVFKKKRSGDIIDMTMLQKKGLLKDEKPSSENKYLSSDTGLENEMKEPIDLGQNSSLNSSTSSTEPAGNFFSTMETSAVSSSPDTSTNFQTDPAEKERVDKIEGRVEHILDRMYKILQRIEILERKIERLERRSGIGGSYETY